MNHLFSTRHTSQKLNNMQDIKYEDWKCEWYKHFHELFDENPNWLSISFRSDCVTPERRRIQLEQEALYREWHSRRHKDDESPIEFRHPSLRISVEHKQERTEEIALIEGTYAPTSRYTITSRYKKPISRYKKEEKNGS